MQLIKKKFKQIIADHPQYAFEEGVDFMWSPVDSRIYFAPVDTQEGLWTLLHELAHAQLGHNEYSHDITLLRHETAAWQHALANLGPKYNAIPSEDFIQDHLDTYRDWLNRRSTCPDCAQNGVQTNANTYSCNNCRCAWRVNEARLCGLQRTRLQEQSLI